MFVVAVSVFWYDRNRHMFDGPTHGNVDLFMMIQARARECMKVFSLDVSAKDVSPCLTFSSIGWYPSS